MDHIIRAMRSKQKGETKSMMPNKKQIVEKARELYAKDCFRTGCSELCESNPETEELKEDGYLNAAQSELMSSNATKYELEKWKVYSEQTENFADFQFDLKEAMKNGIYISGTTGSGKSDAGMYAVEQMLRENIAIVVFDSSQDWMLRSGIERVHTLTSVYIQQIPEKPIIFDTSILSVQQSQRLVESFSEQLMRHQAQKMLDRKTYFLVFEEAHTIFPEGCMRAKRYENTVKMMTQGRNFNVRFMCITQFASLIDKNAMRYMTQRYFGQTNEPNDIAYIRKIIGKDSEQLKTLDAGQFLYFNKGNVSKIGIEPFKANISRIQIDQDVPKIEVVKPINAPPNYATAKAVIMSLLLLMGIAYGLSQLTGMM
jgi:hypothetical protein